MRYLILTVITLIATMLTGVFPLIPIFGVQPDLLLISMLSMLLLEKTPIPVLFTAGGALLLDVLFAPAIGYYSMPYVAVGLTVYLITKDWQENRFIVPPVLCAAAWLVKDVLTATLTFFLGNVFDFGSIFAQSTLPGMLINAVLMFAIYLSLHRLYSLMFMRPIRTNFDDGILEARRPRARSLFRKKGI